MLSYRPVGQSDLSLLNPCPPELGTAAGGRHEVGETERLGPVPLDGRAADQPGRVGPRAADRRGPDRETPRGHGKETVGP